MRHDDERRDDQAGENARLEAGRARLQARLALEAERVNRRSRSSLVPARWVAVAAVAAMTLAAASLLPSRGEETPRRAVAIDADALPVAALTPGATIDIGIGEVCASSPEGPPDVDAAVRAAVLRSYGMEGVPPEEYELDYLITPQLGGAPDARNLWPQRYRQRVWNAGVKDQLEDLLPRLVCEGRVDLRTAQRDIALDWVAAYRKYFRTTSPLQPAMSMALASFAPRQRWR